MKHDFFRWIHPIDVWILAPVDGQTHDLQMVLYNLGGRRFQQLNSIQKSDENIKFPWLRS